MGLVNFPLEDVVGSPKFVSSWTEVWVGWGHPGPDVVAALGD